MGQKKVPTLVRFPWGKEKVSLERSSTVLCGVVLLGIVQVTTEFLAVALNVPRLVLNNLNKEEEYSMDVIGNEWATSFC